MNIPLNQHSNLRVSIHIFLTEKEKKRKNPN